jgi:hypothetical protein
MVTKVKQSLLNMPPAFWISVISLLSMGIMAFAAVKFTSIGNAQDIDKLDKKIDIVAGECQKGVSKVQAVLDKRHDDCNERVTELTKAFSDHCAWGSKSKAEQDGDRALLKKDMGYIQGSLARQEIRLDQQDAKLESLRKMLEEQHRLNVEILNKVRENGS